MLSMLSEENDLSENLFNSHSKYYRKIKKLRVIPRKELSDYSNDM